MLQPPWSRQPDRGTHRVLTIYLALNATSVEWKRSVREWHAVKSQFAIMFEERFPMA